MRVKVDQHKCTGCLLCEITCSLVHGGQVRREASAIQVHLSYLDHGHHRPMVCRQCKKMQCLKSQGKDADDARRKAFIWEGDAQVLEDCAFNALVAIDGKLIHCNLCGGDPQCVKSCPTGALALSDAARDDNEGSCVWPLSTGECFGHEIVGKSSACKEKQLLVSGLVKVHAVKSPQNSLIRCLSRVREWRVASWSP